MNGAHPNDACDVAIVGLGPTGLILAHMLGQAGHKVIVLEREPVFYGNARAVYTDDECMRIFQHLDVVDEVQSRMMTETPVQLVRRDGTPITQYMPRKRPFGWPVINFFYQPYLETTLAETLARYPSVEVRRGREVVDFVQDVDGVSVTHQATREARFSDSNDARARVEGDPDIRTLRARYLVGADGGRSIVRTKLGIEMSGKSFPEPWLVVDLERKPGTDALRHLPYFNFVVDPKLPVVSCVQPGKFHRFEFMLMPGETKENMERPETVRKYLSRFVDPDQFVVKRKLVYTFNALIASKWRVGRVLLGGDAAHMTPQFMGQGASSGVRDAYNLGWKLDLVLRDLADEALLDTYQSERHAHAKAMINTSVLLKNVVSARSPFATLLRDASLGLIRTVPPLRRWFQEGGFKPMPVYRKNAYLGLPRRRRNGPEGALIPQPEVRLFNGDRKKLDDLLGHGFSLIGLNIDPLRYLNEASLATMVALSTSTVTMYPYGGRPQGLDGVDRDNSTGVVEVEDVGGDMIAWFKKAGFKTEAVAVLRPDRFTFAVIAPSELDRTVRQLHDKLGLQLGARKSIAGTSITTPSVAKAA
ncbi:bifunctional 3-(3-hydroxy-phenyl)propionate/3-hydroxycinnamic acid hydroxylase [Burkholderia humptydooensis]|uniref:Bifunctional 3-(3-hydroxy-phenyl)propionate/3-hydroxycinnamic acid hydroxylase n=2 Tax=Burkholderia humptydooensis TaxID=430531 RepID=A0A7U4SSS9_9BURK|nr:MULTISPECIES: bifunctional 3-(3-hydroxy-phenyl)propionate/3-hydroxycinnamic acid hydroxylase [Burkholderia]AJY44314.1 thi4 family protein [Burkholderia sp. 2002721687]ALX43163.1 3-(3-hydroxyphenyl)propionate hydroxylase [Burkholderia humptydooensis]EIP84738.1 3-(3-hydroxy-phenyl)propionate hydroxylase [Burkholderia humptydooensis MSMB43]QPS44925.1 bifunctional 3-(3-hydroxy-phenyl)propionate/3-hydroxycinnamic acid hydroxylase [Burkholderia humptydooensis]